MIQFQCPFCSTDLSAPAEYKGKKVRCHSCQKKFVLSVNEPEPDPLGLPAAEPMPDLASVPPSFATPAAPRKPRRSRRGGANRSFSESDQWSTLFDLGFNSWIAPKICSVLYLCSIIGFVIYGVVLTFLFVLSAVGLGVADNGDTLIGLPMAVVEYQAATSEQVAVEEPIAIQGAQFIQSGTVAQFRRQPQFNQPNFNQPDFGSVSSGSKAFAFFIGLLTYLLIMLSLFMGVMMSRLIFETILAQFYR